MIGGRVYGYRSRNAVAGVPRRNGSLPALRCACRFRAGRPTLTTEAPRTRVPQEGRREPEPARAEAEGQLFGFGPRGGLSLEGFRRPCHLAGEFLVGNALAHNPRHGQIEAVPVVHLAAVV